jgi:hypothetical protein
MAERKQQTKAERREAAGGQQTKADRKQEDGGQQTKADRKQARTRRRQRPGSAAEAVEPMAGGDGSSDDGIELRLAQLEQAVAAQSELSEQLLGKLDEVLHEARKSARHDLEGQEEPAEGS